MEIVKNQNGTGSTPVKTWELQYNYFFSWIGENFEEGINALAEFMNGKQCFVQTFNSQPMVKHNHLNPQAPTPFFHLFVTLRKGGEFHSELKNAITEIKQSIENLKPIEP